MAIDIRKLPKNGAFRWNFHIKNSNYVLLNAIAKENGRNMSEIVNALIEQKLSDPIKLKKAELKVLGQKIYKLQQEIKELEGNDE